MEFYADFFRYISKLQNGFNSLIASNFREIKDELSITALLIIFGISFIYGVIHALGPGHGKALVTSYFISNKKSYKEAFKLGYLISIIHAFSALTVTFILYFIIKTMISKNFHETSIYMTKFSGLLIIMVGIYLFFEHHKSQKEKIDSNKSIYALATSAAIVPCPGVMTVVLFSLMMGKIIVGVIASILMSIGMGITISLSGVVATFARDKSPSKLTKILPYIGNSFIILLGCYLFFR